MGKHNPHFQNDMEKSQENNSHHDCTVATPPPRFNPVPCCDCYTANTYELTAEAPDETSDGHVQKETARETTWRSFKHRMNEN
jgi:hypothetical protein